MLGARCWACRVAIRRPRGVEGAATSWQPRSVMYTSSSAALYSRLVRVRVWVRVRARARAGLRVRVGAGLRAWVGARNRG